MTKVKFNIIGKETPKFHLCMIFFFGPILSWMCRITSYIAGTVCERKPGSLAFGFLCWLETSAAWRGVLRQSLKGRFFFLSLHFLSVRLWKSLTLQPFPRWQGICAVINISLVLRVVGDSSPPFLGVPRVALWGGSRNNVCSVSFLCFIHSFQIINYFAFTLLKSN